MPVSSPSPALPADKAGGDFSDAVTKWLVPSVTVLFAVVGYISQVSQETLLGLRTDPTSSRFVISAAQFFFNFGEVLGGAATGLLDGKAISFGGHGAFVTAVMLATIMLTAASRAARRWWPSGATRVTVWRARLLLLALTLVIGFKFALLDAPLAPLNNIILEVGGDQTAGKGLTFEERAKWEGGFEDASRGKAVAEINATQKVADKLAARSSRIWKDLVCSRVGPVAKRDRNNFGCPLLRDASRDELTGLFMAQLWTGAAIGALAVAAIRVRAGGGAGAGLAVLALAYLLTVPYAHGKLMRSTYFDLGAVRLASTLLPDPLDRTDERSFFGMILARNSTGTDLLVASPETCGGTDQQGFRVTLTTVAPSQLLSVERIYRQDVITWAALNRKPCPDTMPTQVGP